MEFTNFELQSIIIILMVLLGYAGFLTWRNFKQSVDSSIDLERAKCDHIKQISKLQSKLEDSKRTFDGLLRDAEHDKQEAEHDKAYAQKMADFMQQNMKREFALHDQLVTAKTQILTAIMKENNLKGAELKRLNAEWMHSSESLHARGVLRKAERKLFGVDWENEDFTRRQKWTEINGSTVPKKNLLDKLENICNTRSRPSIASRIVALHDRLSNDIHIEKNSPIATRVILRQKYLKDDLPILVAMCHFIPINTFITKTP